MFEKKPLTFKIKEVLSEEEKLLKVAGIMLYWAEGSNSKNAQTVDFANSNPKMIVIFTKFLRKICGIREKKLRAFLYCYSNQRPTELVEYWSKLTGISVK